MSRIETPEFAKLRRSFDVVKFTMESGYSAADGHLATKGTHECVEHLQNLYAGLDRFEKIRIMKLAFAIGTKLITDMEADGCFSK